MDVALPSVSAVSWECGHYSFSEETTMRRKRKAKKRERRRRRNENTISRPFEEKLSFKTVVDWFAEHCGI